MIALLLGARLLGVVDQIDAGWALVEWGGRAFGFVPVDQLPEGVVEGDRIVLRPDPHGSPIELPREVAPDAVRPYAISLHPKRGPKRSPWRTQ